MIWRFSSISNSHDIGDRKQAFVLTIWQIGEATRTIQSLLRVCLRGGMVGRGFFGNVQKKRRSGIFFVFVIWRRTLELEEVAKGLKGGTQLRKVENSQDWRIWMSYVVIAKGQETHVFVNGGYGFKKITKLGVRNRWIDDHFFDIGLLAVFISEFVLWAYVLHLG